MRSNSALASAISLARSSFVMTPPHPPTYWSGDPPGRSLSDRPKVAANSRLVKGINRLLIVASVVTMAACGGGSAAAPSPSPDLAAEYLKLVAPLNSVLDQNFPALNASPLVLAQLQPAVQRIVDAEVAFSSGLLAMESHAGTALKAHIENARSEMAKEIADLQLVEQCSDVVCANDRLNRWQAGVDAGGQVFVLLRSDLGLPPPPVFSPSPS